MKTDSRALEISNADELQIRALDGFSRRLLRLDRDIEQILTHADESPSCILLQLYAVAFYLYAQTNAGNQQATAYLKRAEALAQDATPRELLLLGAFKDWLAGAFSRALEKIESLTENWPKDLTSAKFAEFLYYLLGQQYNGRRFLRHMERLRKYNGDDPDFLSMYSFSLELCDRQEDARRAAEKSLERETRQPWSHHTLAHVLIRQGKIDEGLNLLNSYLPIWESSGRAIESHNAWHLSLVHVDARDFPSAEKVLHKHVWGITPDMNFEQIDTIALLWRMEMAGHRMQDSLWKDVATHSLPHSAECLIPFISSHFAYALSRAGEIEALDALLANARKRASDPDDEALRVWAPVGRAVVEASADFGHGDYRSGLARMDPVMDKMTMIGGSDAQDDLFRQAYLVALNENGRHSDALSFLTRWNANKLHTTPLDHYWESLAKSEK